MNVVHSNFDYKTSPARTGMNKPRRLILRPTPPNYNFELSYSFRLLHSETLKLKHICTI